MRRRHTAEFKRGVIQACRQPGVSIAAIALANGLNANMVRKWVSEAQVQKDETEAQGQRPAGSLPAARAADNKLAAGFVAMPVAPAESVAPICIEITRGSTVGQQALERIQLLCRIEEEVRELEPDERRRRRQERAGPLAQELYSWMLRQQEVVPPGLATAKALLYSLRAGQRAAAVMSLLQSARINGQDPCAYIKDVLTRLLLQPNSRIQELQPHRWQPTSSAS